MAEGTFESELPVESEIKIFPGTDFASQLFQHLDAAEQPIDTTGWSFPGAGIYESSCCDADLVLDLSDKVVLEPLTPWGYQIVIDAADSNLPCGEYWYKLPALQVNNGNRIIPTFAGPAIVSQEGGGDA
jgi:hypothetical protein